MGAQELEVLPVRPRMVRQYSQQERSQALALYDTVGNLEKTSQTLGIPLSTLAGWVNHPDQYSELRNSRSIDLAQKFENAANQYIDLAQRKAKKAAFQHLMNGAAIAIDKMQLLRGQPTSITSDIHREELLIVMQSAMPSVDSERVIETEGREVAENSG